jgi:hypothetical protein
MISERGRPSVSCRWLRICNALLGSVVAKGWGGSSAWAGRPLDSRFFRLMQSAYHILNHVIYVTNRPFSARDWVANNWGWEGTSTILFHRSRRRLTSSSTI